MQYAPMRDVVLGMIWFVLLRSPVLLATDAAGQRDGTDHRNAQRDGHGNLDGFHALVGTEPLVVADKIVGRVVDTGAGHQREDAAQQK